MAAAAPQQQQHPHQQQSSHDGLYAAMPMEYMDDSGGLSPVLMTKHQQQQQRPHTAMAAGNAGSLYQPGPFPPQPTLLPPAAQHQQHYAQQQQPQHHTKKRRSTSSGVSGSGSGNNAAAFDESAALEHAQLLIDELRHAKDARAKMDGIYNGCVCRSPISHSFMR